MAFFPYESGPLEPLCAELDEWRERLDRRGPLPRRWSGQIRRELEAEAVAASVAMEQVPVTVDEVRRILLGERPASVSETDQELVLGYRNAMEFVLRRADDPSFQWNRELVVGLHDRVLAGNYALGAGRFATGRRWVVNRLTGQVVFEPADWEEVPTLVDTACAAGEALEREAHAAVCAAWIHVVTAAIHPFGDGNGRVARVVASLAMYRGGFQRTEFTSLEEWWGRHLADYYAAFECLGDHFDSSADVTPFIEAHVRAQLSQVRALDLRERTERRIWAALEALVEAARLPSRAVYALWEAFFGRDVTAAHYVPLADVARQTATHDFAALVAAGLVVPHGERRWRRYTASDSLYRRVAGELGMELPEGQGHEWLMLAVSRQLVD